MKVSRADLEFFRRDLWKDERIFQRSFVSDSEFGKFCFTESSAVLEARVLDLLAQVPGELLVPEVVRVDGPQVILRRVDGIRLFDLVRSLRRLELLRRDGKAEEARQALIARSRRRLARIQGVLLENRHELAGEARYPLEDKVSGLLDLFVRVLELQGVPSGWRADLDRLSDYWNAECSLIPFRDATTKNMLFSEARVGVTRALEPDRRLSALSEILDVEPISYWTETELLDIDFSSVEHLTSPEDDPISLHCHEWTSGSCRMAPESFVLLPGEFLPDRDRAAATLLIRYLRFGGRKLAYKLLNSQGFEVRFEFDDPIFYFRGISNFCSELSPGFVSEYRDLIDLIRLIGETVAHFSASEEAQLRVDQFRKFFGQGAEYWQENPIERLEAE